MAVNTHCMAQVREEASKGGDGVVESAASRACATAGGRAHLTGWTIGLIEIRTGGEEY